MIDTALVAIVRASHRVLSCALAAVGDTADMLHVIVMTKGTKDELEAAEVILQRAPSCRRIELGVWLVSTKMRARDYRDKLLVELPETRFLVAQLSGTWAVHSMPVTAGWLKAHGDDV
ncbi:MAG: hypothetical protein ABTD50_20515 [Polyangiaceae bacterium]